MNIIEYTESDRKLLEIYMHSLMHILAMDAVKLRFATLVAGGKYTYAKGT